MGKKRIIDVGKAIEATDAPNKNQLDYIASVVVPFRTPIMTSNTNPVPFVASSPIASSSAWKAFSTTEFYSANSTSQDVALTLDFGNPQRINFVEFELSAICETISLYDQNDTLIASKPSANGVVLCKFDSIETYSIKIVITQGVDLLRISNTFIGYRIVDFESSVLVNTTGLNAAEAVSVAYLNETLLPITTSIIPVYANPPMTSDNTPEPFSIECNVIALEGYEPYKAFNFDVNSNFKAIAVANQNVQLSLIVSPTLPVNIAAFEVSGASDNIDVTTINFILTGLKADQSSDTLYVSNTPLPQVPRVYQIQSDSVYIAFLLDIVPIRTGVVVGLNMLTIYTKAISVTGRRIVSASDPIGPQDAATKNYVDFTVESSLPLLGGTMSGDIDMGGHAIKNVFLTGVDKGDVMSRQGILSTVLATPILGGILPMSQGAILAILAEMNISGTTAVTPLISASGDLIPNPTNGNFFAFNLNDNSIDIVGGSYDVCFQLQFTDTSDPPGFVEVSIETIDGQVLTASSAPAAHSFLLKASLYFEITTVTSVVIKLKHSGAFVKLMSGLCGIYRSANQTRRVVIGTRMPIPRSVGATPMQLPLTLSEIVPTDAIQTAHINVSGNSVVISRYTGLLAFHLVSEITNTSNAISKTVEFQIGVNRGGHMDTTIYGPYTVPTRQGSNDGIRTVYMQGVLRCTGVTSVISIYARCLNAANISIATLSAMFTAV
jgi:hypothetical protein